MASIGPAQSIPSAGGTDSGVMFATLRAFQQVQAQINKPLKVPDMRILTQQKFNGIGGNLDYII